MYFICSRIALVFLLLSISDRLMGHVTLDYPVGGETFTVGETVVIEWHIAAQHVTLNWDLFFSNDGGVTWDTILLDIPLSQLSYEWEVPNIITTQGRIRVIQDNVDQNYLDFSMDFSIVPNTAPPVLDAPASNITIPCNSMNQQAAIQAWLDDHGGAAATNYCGDLIWTHDYLGISNACGATGSTGVTFMAMDVCGLVTTNAILTIADTSPPIITLPAANMLVESNGNGNLPDLQNWLNQHGHAQATDVCGNVSWSHDFTTLSDGCGTTGSTTVTFSATDACGNVSITSATFTIVDQLAPSISPSAQNITLECGSSNQQTAIQQWLNNHGGAIATDMGGDVIWSNNFSALSDGCGASGSATVIFAASDECGNMTSTSSTINIEDHFAPTINTPAQNIILECNAIDQLTPIQNWLNNHGGAQATDICSDVIWTHDFSGLSNGCGSTGSAVIRFTASDACGNNVSSEAKLTVVDSQSAVVDIEARDTTIICRPNDSHTDIESWLNRHGGASSQDLCGSVVWTHNFPMVPDTCGPVGTHTIIFTAQDECGNVNTTSATLTIMDTMITSIQTIQDFSFEIYPNPVNELLTIDYKPNEFTWLEIHLLDAFGKHHWSNMDNDGRIVLSFHSYTSGVYFLHIKTDLGTYVHKVIHN